MTIMSALAPAALDAASLYDLTPGEVQLRSVDDDPRQRYFLYVPRETTAPLRTFVAVHGISRNAREHARRFSRYAESYGVVLVAPLFPRNRYADYQRIGREGRGQRADHALNRILREVGRLTGADTERFYLFGFSGGGQFAHRYAMAYPERVARMALGSAGWYTFPDTGRSYPAGIRASEALPGARFRPDRFLRIPAFVLVGEKDTTRDPQLKKSRRIDQQQGTTRVERGRRWVDAMRQAARAHGLQTHYDFKLVQDTGHSFTRSMTRGQLGAEVFRFLFDPLPGVAASSDPARGQVVRLY